MPSNKFDIIRFVFETPLHIGNERSDYSTGRAQLHSDALYAAICHTWARLGHSDWIPSEENDHTALTISSLFPFLNYGDQYSYFLPKPLLLVNNSEVDTSIDTRNRKALKKVQWVDLSVFQALAAGTPLQTSTTFFEKGFQSIKTLPQERSGESIHPYQAQVVPRAAVSRYGDEDTVIYYISRYYFHENAGLYAFFQCSDAEIKNRLRIALELLQQEGLGTDRNVGNGHFSFEFGQLEMELPDDASYGMNIGLYCPSDKNEWLQFSEYEHHSPRAGYSIIRRGGWLSEPHNTWRKRSVYMIQPGSILHTGTTRIAGKVVNLEPIGEGINTGHKVWRNGRSIFLPVKG